jgi:hypothetical protein
MYLVLGLKLPELPYTEHPSISVRAAQMIRYWNKIDDNLNLRDNYWLDILNCTRKSMEEFEILEKVETFINNLHRFAPTFV